MKNIVHKIDNNKIVISTAELNIVLMKADLEQISCIIPLAYEKSINVPALIITIVVAKRISSEKLLYGKIRLVVIKSITIIANIIAKVVTAIFLLTLGLRE